MHFMHLVDKSQLFAGAPQVQCLFETLDHIITAITENTKKKNTDKDDKVEEVKDDYNIDIEESLARDPSISMSNGELPLMKEYMSNAAAGNLNAR